ncbi:MAG: PEP/pyruvate-binding domain-containing protein, partial [Cyanobacteriota bacterium]|nr:PEP/pyruvate-binding domain-containing protein [Cyanobacteriota bacterium]
MSFSLSAIIDGVEHLHGLHEIAPTDLEVVGDRAFYLANFMQRGYSAIPGFVVSANIYHEFLETLDWREPLFVDFATSSLHLDLEDPRQLQAIAQRIRNQILTSQLSSELRTSLEFVLSTLNTQAFRFYLSLNSLSIPTDGLFDPVMSWANLDAVEQGIKQAWAELFRARNLLYWQHNNIQLEQLQPTLLVQLIPEAIASGSVQINPEFWKIEVSAGLDLADLWGQTHPDRYYLDPQTQNIQDQHLGYKIISYHLKSSDNTQHSDQDAQWREFAQCSLSPLQSPIAVKLSKSPQDPVLNSEQLRSLIEFIKPIATELGASGLIEWTLSESGEFA